MAREWGNWKPDEWKSKSAYVDWWQKLTPDGFDPRLDGTSKDLSSDIIVSPINAVLEFLNYEHEPAGMKSAPAKLGSGLAVPHEAPGEAENRDTALAFKQADDDLAIASIPAFANNIADFNNQIAISKDKTWLPPDKLLPTLTDPDTVIVGVIDTGVPLYHQRFLESRGESRILAAWNQGAEHLGQVYLPFGREIYKKDIDTALEAGMSEEDFNLRHGLVDMKNSFGRRDLAVRAAHGAHVLDTAAGYPDNDARRDKVKIIAVNLPHRQTLGQAGEFLDQFVAYGMLRILHLAVKIWENSGLSGKPRVVMNLSYGRQAGSKDGMDLLPKMASLAPQTKLGTGTQFDLILPAGNDNLARRNAHFSLKPGKPSTLTWRILPDDRSANYVEIWTDFISLKATDSLPLAVKLDLDGQVTDQDLQGLHKVKRELGEIGSIYCECVPEKDGTCRLRYLVCLAPTLRYGEKRSEAAPAGDWRITLTYDKTAEFPDELEVTVAIQTDQALLPAGGDGFSSFFVDPKQKRFDDAGRSVDVFSDRHFGGHYEEGYVRQEGTINASGVGLVTVAGYRDTDGRPAVYSCTGFTQREEDGPCVAMVSDDGYAHPGTIGAGSSDGSRVAMSGTSFATALATRFVVEAYLKDPARAPAQAQEILQGGLNGNPDYYVPFKPQKLGKGRVKSSLEHQVKRRA